MSKFKFDFNAASRKAKFELPEVANVAVSVEDVVTGKKSGRKFAIFVIDNKRYMVEDGDINESANFDAVINAADKKAGYLSLLDGARITISGGTISWSVAA